MTKILTTHVGSLPRTQTVVDYIFAREAGEDYDAAAFDAAMTAAVSKTVQRQVEAGVDIVSDGETSKISYATYVKDRYTGFDGDSPRNAPADLKRFPTFLDRIAKEGGTPKYARPMCVGPVASKGQGGLEKDIANLRAAMGEQGIERGFMNAASPGVISLFLQNDHYPTRDAYLAALAVLFETSNPRHGHEWGVFRDRKADIPDDKVLVPGVVDTTTNFVEHPELVAERIGRFVDIVGAERVIAGSDCGFGTFAGFGAVDPEIAYAKLGALAEGAGLVK
ncbi:MAG: hypothetical protein LC676_03660 [Loktanella sp.]|nr:hypothetical protein [Loktanella sp.]